MVKRVLAKDESGVRFSLSAPDSKGDMKSKAAWKAAFDFIKVGDKVVDMWIKDTLENQENIRKS